MTDTLDRPDTIVVAPMEGEPDGRAGAVTFVVVASVAVAAIVTGLWLLLRAGSPAPSDDILVQDGSGRVRLLAAETGAAVFDVPNAVVTPDRSAILTTEHTAAGTVIESRDPSTGEVTGTTTVFGELEIRTVSPRGDAIALMAPRGTGLGLYEPESRTETEITIAFTDERPAVRYTLDGNFEPEVFSYDADVLYLLQFEPAEAPDHYLVRELDVDSGLVGEVASPQVDLQPEMRGVARAQAVAPDGRRVYTVYTIPSDADPVHDVEAPGDAGSDDTARWAFVHVLDLEEGYDFCIFLPVPMGTVNEATVGVGLGNDGRTLYVVDPASAMVARIDTTTLEIVDLHQVPEIWNLTARAEVAVADDGTLFVGLDSVVHQLAPWQAEDGATGMSLLGGWSFDGPVSDLSLDAAGRRLRLAAAGTVVVIDPASGEEVATLTPPADGGDGGLSILGPPSGNVVRIPFECAC